jgi:hypothetical protein
MTRKRNATWKVHYYGELVLLLSTVLGLHLAINSKTLTVVFLYQAIWNADIAIAVHSIQTYLADQFHVV